MSGVKISEANVFAAAQLADKLAAARGVTPGSLTLEKIKNLFAAQGFLIGDSSAIYAQNQSNNDRWQLDQKALELPVDLVPDLTQNDTFSLTNFNTPVEIQAPINSPTTNVGAFYFKIYVVGTGTLTFDSSYVEMPGSKVFDNTDSPNIVHCYFFLGVGTYYRIENNQHAPGETQLTEGVITSAQILNSNTSPVELIAAPGAGKLILIDSISYLKSSGTGYDTNIVAYFGHNGEDEISVNLGNATCKMNETVTITDFSDVVNTNFAFHTNTGDPENGTFDIFYSIKYRIIDDPFA